MSDQPAKARTEKWEPSDFCKRGEHGWCMNRNPAECHCGCPCHEQQRPTAEAQLAATHAAIRALPLEKMLRDMQHASTQIDEAKDGTAYQLGLVSLALMARHFLRECAPALARLLGDPEGKG